jgi:hypothetical protein
MQLLFSVYIVQMMKLVIDIFFRLVSHLPKLLSWWLYSPKRTKANVEVFISAQQGSVEVWCDKCQSKFNVMPEFENKNPFPIEIDRVEISAQLHNASMKAVNIIGATLETNQRAKLYLTGKLDESSLIQVNEAPVDEPMSLVVKAVIVNRHHYIRDYRACCPKRLLK